MSEPAPSVVLTRSEPDNAALAARLVARGWTVIEAPTVAITAVAPDQNADEVRALLASAPAIAFTSRYGVQAWWELAGAAELKAALERGAEIGVIGQATADALLAQDVHASVVADPATGTALAEQLLDRLPSNNRNPCVLLQGRHARPELRDGLLGGGRDVQTVVVYENRTPPPPSEATLSACAGAAAIYVAAPSAADRLLSWAPTLCERPFVAIGPTTSAALADRHGIVAAAVAENPGIDAVVAAITRLIDVWSPP